jgi:hypothetical protein
MVDPPSLGRYLLGALLMVGGVVAPLALAWSRNNRRGLAASRGMGCVRVRAACAVHMRLQAAVRRAVRCAALQP